MSRYRFEVATQADNDDLRHILATTDMEGDIRLALTREPNYFHAVGVEGAFSQVIAARDLDTGRVVGFGLRSVDRRYVNGEPQPIGYLSQLRLLPEHRNRGLVVRGYAQFRQRHDDGRTALYLTTVSESNRPALRLLTSSRAGLPRYQPAGSYHTFALPVYDGRRELRLPSGISIDRWQPSDTAEVNAFLERLGPLHQFFPCYSRAEFESGQGRLHGLKCSNFWLARSRGELVGMLAGWDQRDFRQIVVQGYARWLSLARPVYNAWACLAGRPRLPASGSQVAAVTLALPLFTEKATPLLGVLVDAVAQQHAAAGAQVLLLGLHENDPLRAVVRNWSAVRYTTQLFYVYWTDGGSLAQSIDPRPAYLELGCL